MSTKTEPSPGPWAVVPREECSGVKLVDVDGEFIEYLNDSRYVDERKDPEQVANLSVIGASMDLLAALKAEVARARSAYEDTPGAEEHFRRNHAASLAAIAKAEGGDA